MKYHFAGTCTKVEALETVKPKFVLESFFYVRKLNPQALDRFMAYINSEHCEHFILDSGAFTYMFASKEAQAEIRENYHIFLEEYAEFIKKWNIKNYIELDLDSIFGYAKVKEITAELEEAVGWPCMPVFHNRFRTKQDLIDIVNNYDYMCISNIDGNKGASIFPKLKAIVDFAEAQGTRVHGLALTSKRVTQHIPNFFSIDSTTWLSGPRFGQFQVFDPVKRKMVNSYAPEGKRLNSTGEWSKKLDIHCMTQWCLFADYLETLGDWDAR